MAVGGNSNPPVGLRFVIGQFQWQVVVEWREGGATLSHLAGRCVRVVHNTSEEGSLEQTIPVVGFSHSSKRTGDTRSFDGLLVLMLW